MLLNDFFKIMDMIDDMGCIYESLIRNDKK